MTALDRFRLDGKVAVVTGAGRNIGLEIARACADVGASVVMFDRDAKLVETQAASIADETKSIVTPFVGDVASVADVQALSEFIHDRFGQADVLVNNAHHAGQTASTDILSISDQAWIEILQVNLLGPYRLSAALGRHMRQGRGGSIINLLSTSGFLPTQSMAPYGSSKAALWMLTRYMAQECAPQVRVNALCPGLTVSPTRETLPSSADELLETIPMGRFGQANEVAAAAIYLASDAASYTTGAVLVVNGGRPW